MGCCLYLGIGIRSPGTFRERRNDQLKSINLINVDSLNPRCGNALAVSLQEVKSLQIQVL